jgi:hypothetical protein
MTTAGASRSKSYRSHPISGVLFMEYEMVRGVFHPFAQSHVAIIEQLEQSLVRYSLH